MLLILVIIEKCPATYLRVNQSLPSKLLPASPLQDLDNMSTLFFWRDQMSVLTATALTGALRTSDFSKGTGVSGGHFTHKVQGPATHTSTWRSPASPYPSPLSSLLLLLKERPRQSCIPKCGPAPEDTHLPPNKIKQLINQKG